MFTHKTSLAFLLAENVLPLASHANNSNWLNDAIESAELISDNDIIYNEVYTNRNPECFDVCTTLMNWGVGLTCLSNTSLTNDPNAIDEVVLQRPKIYGMESASHKRKATIANFTRITERGVEVFDTFEMVAFLIEQYAQTEENRESDTALLDWIRHQQLSYKDLQSLWKLTRFEKDTNMPNPKRHKSLRKYTNSLEQDK